MSITPNHSNILQFARRQQWEQMHATTDVLHMAHVRQAFYVLCKEGRADAIEQLKHHFSANHDFICECLVGGLKHNITLEALSVLEDIVCKHPITQHDVLEACLQTQRRDKDALTQRIVPWYDPAVCELHKNHLFLSLRINLMNGEGLAFLAMIKHWNFENLSFCSRVVDATVEFIPHLSDAVFDVIGEDKLRTDAVYLNTNNNSVALALDDYFARQQYQRLTTKLNPVTQTRISRKI